MAIVSQSPLVGRSCNIHAPSKAAQTGAVYCSRIAFAAVVILLAMAKSIVQTAYTTAAPSWSGDHVNRTERQHTTSRNVPAIRPRPAAAARPGHSTNLKSTPARLQQSEAPTNRPTERVWAGSRMERSRMAERAAERNQNLGRPATRRFVRAAGKSVACRAK